MVTTYCPRMGLEPTLKDQSSRKSIHVVHANYHGGKTPGERCDLGLKLQNIVNARAGKRYLAIIKVAEITDSGRSGTNRRFEDILDVCQCGTTTQRQNVSVSINADVPAAEP